MAPLDIRKSEISDAHLRAYVDLFAESFPSSALYNTSYLTWQYAQNPAGTPIGYDAWDGDTLAAHYVTVPFDANLDGMKVRALLSLNTATRPSYQGRGLFVELAKQTYAEGARLGYACVVGVANANSTPGFIRRLEFQLVSSLIAQVGFGLRVVQGPKEAKFQRLWNAEALAWRMGCPRQPVFATTRDDRGQFWAPTGKPMMIAVTERPVENWPNNHTNRSAPWRAEVFVGLLPAGSSLRGAQFPVPQALRPSPLNFIYRPLHDARPNLKREEIMFDFLDFDAF